MYTATTSPISSEGMREENTLCEDCREKARRKLDYEHSIKGRKKSNDIFWSVVLEEVR